MLQHQPANRPGPRHAVVTDKGRQAGGTPRRSSPATSWADLIRPGPQGREGSPDPSRMAAAQRVEAIIGTLKNQLGSERHGGPGPAGGGQDRAAPPRAQRCHPVQWKMAHPSNDPSPLRPPACISARQSRATSSGVSSLAAHQAAAVAMTGGREGAGQASAIISARESVTPRVVKVYPIEIYHFVTDSAAQLYQHVGSISDTPDQRLIQGSILASA